MKVAVYAISKNESKHVKRWLAATQGADYRVVLDTGSTDNTAELLEAAGVTVGRIEVVPWRFDVARNAALDLVPKDADVCVILDMDEIPEKQFFSKIRKQWVPGAHRGWITLDVGHYWQADRLHSREGWKWRWPCHEVAMWQGGDDSKYCHTTAIIKHQPDTTKSRSLYLPMLEAAVVEDPTDARMWTYLCREYYFTSDWLKVIECAEKALSFDGWDVEMAGVCRWAGDACRNLNLPATEWFDQGTVLAPEQGEPWFAVAIDAFRNHDWSKCLDACIRVIELPRSTHYLYEPSAWDWKAYDFAASSAFNLRYLDEAITFAKRALRGGSTEPDRIKRNLKFMEDLKHGFTSANHARAAR